MKAFRLTVIVLMSLLALGAFSDGSPTYVKTKEDSFNQEIPSFSPDIVGDPYSSASRARRSDGRHRHGFIAGAATGAVVANHHQPNYYAPTHYYPPAYYPPPNYHDNGYNYYY